VPRRVESWAVGLSEPDTPRSLPARKQDGSAKVRKIHRYDVAICSPGHIQGLLRGVLYWHVGAPLRPAEAKWRIVLNMGWKTFWVG